MSEDRSRLCLRTGPVPVYQPSWALMLVSTKHRLQGTWADSGSVTSGAQGLRREACAGWRWGSTRPLLGQASPPTHCVWPVGTSPGCRLSFLAQILAPDPSPFPWCLHLLGLPPGIHFLSSQPEHQALQVFPQ